VTPGDDHVIQVRARYDAGYGDLSTPFDADLEVPLLETLSPSSAWAGETVRIALEGDGLYLLQGATTLSFGEGIAVADLAVTDVRHLTAVLTVAADAVPGPRDVSIGGTWGESVFPGTFSVLDSALAPGIATVAPSSLHQGDKTEITVVATQPFGELPTVQGDGELVVTGVPSLDAPDTVRFTVAVAGDAEVGDHTLVLDDATRLWTLPITVQQTSYEVGGGCDSTPERAPLGTGLLLGILLAARGSPSRRGKQARV
jgi:hypothetical protein